MEEVSLGRAAAVQFRVNASSAFKLTQRIRATGSAVLATIAGYRTPLLVDHYYRQRELTATRKGI